LGIPGSGRCQLWFTRNRKAGCIGGASKVKLEGQIDQAGEQTYGEGKLRSNWNTPIKMSPNARVDDLLGAIMCSLARSRSIWDRLRMISPPMIRKVKPTQEESGA